MNNLNSILLEGYLTKDPQEKIIEGSSLSNFSIGSNRYYKKDGEQVQDTSFFNIDVWGKTAEYCNQYLKKGSGVRVVGRLKQERWQDIDGKQHSQIKVIAEHVDFFPNKKNKQKAQESHSETDMPEREEIEID